MVLLLNGGFDKHLPRLATLAKRFLKEGPRGLIFNNWPSGLEVGQAARMARHPGILNQVKKHPT